MKEIFGLQVTKAIRVWGETMEGSAKFIHSDKWQDKAVFVWDRVEDVVPRLHEQITEQLYK